MTSLLDIHTLDVGQGDSALIDVTDGAGNSRSLLIDGGLPEKAHVVHNYVQNALAGRRLDAVLVTNYDRDHRGGVEALLASDNLWHASQTIALAAGRAPAPGATRPQL